MANYVKNRIYLPSNEVDYGHMLDLLAGPEGEWGDVDFNGLVPMPKDVYRGPLGPEELACYPGEANWYEWSIAHWGTKWNAWDGNICGNYIEFTTAWNAVPELMKRLSEQLLDVIIDYHWADEDIGFNVGGLALRNGKIIGSIAFEEGSAEAIAFARELWDIEDEDEEE